MHIAAQRNYIDILWHLVHFGADINARVNINFFNIFFLLAIDDDDDALRLHFFFHLMYF